MNRSYREPNDEVYRLVSRPINTGLAWRPERAADGKVRVYPKLATARSVRSQIQNQYYEYKIQKCVQWTDVE